MAPQWERRFLDHSDTLTGFYARAFTKDICVDGEPLVLSSVISGERAHSIYAELTQPEGITPSQIKRGTNKACGSSVTERTLSKSCRATAHICPCSSHTMVTYSPNQPDRAPGQGRDVP